MNRNLGRMLVAALLALAARESVGQEWRGPESFEVRVEDAEGRDLEGAEVVLDYAGRELGGPAPMLTDGRGRLAIGGLLPGRWALEVRKPGFMSFRAEIALADGEKPQIVVASQHNVPGAVSTMRVRLARAKSAPPAPARVERVAPTVPPPTPPAPSAPPRPPAVPAEPEAVAAALPGPHSSPAPAPAAPEVAAPPSATAAPAAPEVPAPELQIPAAEAPPSVPATEPVAVAPAPAVLEAPPAAASEVSPVAPAAPPAPPAEVASVSAPAPAATVTPPAAPVPPQPGVRVTAAAPIARACYECRPGESALLAEAEIAAGGDACPADLAERLAKVGPAELPSLAAGLPSGCAVLRVELPAGARFVGFRYEAAGANGRSEDCLPGRLCPAGSCRFPLEPVIREDGGRTLLLAAFESSAARRGGFTVYWRRTR